MKSQLARQSDRENPRYKSKSDLLVVKTLHKDPQTYQVMDLSTGGLSFRYLGKKLPLHELDKISLFYGHELILEAILVHPASDCLLRGNLVPVRRRSVQFISLTEEQQSKLEFCIRKYTELPE